MGKRQMDSGTDTGNRGFDDNFHLIIVQFNRDLNVVHLSAVQVVQLQAALSGKSVLKVNYTLSEKRQRYDIQTAVCTRHW